ncbi:MAG: Crp/Fnr family transcriptional regulator [Bacteroidota bacterium]
MNAITFSEYLTSNTNLSPEIILEVENHCAKKIYKKGEFLNQAGEVSRYSFFVEKGLAKQYGIDSNGKEHIVAFAPESWFVSDRDSLYCKLPSVYYIQALEDTTVYLIDEVFMQKLSETDSSFAEFNTKLLHNNIRHLTNRIYMLLSATAEERYQYFIKTYPDITLRVPQTLIASYLGITPESLSRVRKELARKNFNR